VHPKLDRDGFIVLPVCARAERLASLDAGKLNVSATGAGRRNLLSDSPSVRNLAENELAAWLRPFGLHDCFPVRALLFDKTPDANWKVPWHQDLSIAVAERREAPGFSGWSLKEGVWHVQPPAGVLARMITLRLHLDDCGPVNGPLKVIPGSHREGRLSRERIEWWKGHGEIVECHVPSGGALLMRPLLLHSSTPARQASHRRVLHIEYAAHPLPAGLHWAVESPAATVEDLGLTCRPGAA
jgi:ectoine hydroxylase-related dioxygenase (phytanoyl-CoA dioxygenase family)